MALDNFIPSVWSARLLANMHKVLVFGQEGVVNRDYEGEIRQFGDTVKINAIGAVTIGTYTKNSDISAPEALSDSQTTLTIDQAKYFNFQIDDVDAAQQKPKVMDAAMAEAAYALADAADQYIASLYTGVASSNRIGDDTTPETISVVAEAYEYLVNLAVLLDEANVPRAARWVVVPPWYHGLLLKDDRFVKAGTATTDQVLRNGEVGEAAGFRVLKSNNVPASGTTYHVIAGYAGAISFAEQINKVEAYRPERRFADAVKGLHLYGAKLVRPNGIAVLTVTRP